MEDSNTFSAQLADCSCEHFSIFDFLPGENLAEKVTALTLEDTVLQYPDNLALKLKEIQRQIASSSHQDTIVVAFGGGSGLSNIIGGDSRKDGWREQPFTGLKKFFPHLFSIVCVTDDGGSTGELLKDLPLIALGDLRHVLLSSVCQDLLIKRYHQRPGEALKTAQALYDLFNHRFTTRPESYAHLLAESGAVLTDLPQKMRDYVVELTQQLFYDSRLEPTLNRPQCLGNLFLAAAIYRYIDPDIETECMVASNNVLQKATEKGLAELAIVFGARENSVLPCTPTLCQLKVLYDNGVLVSSEKKSGHAKRGYPVDRICLDFSGKPYLSPDVVELIRCADLLIFAPGSLFTSIIPILQVPGIADAIRRNKKALKLLIGNIWVQKGETDTAKVSPDRKFHVSDLVRAYHSNIPGGIDDLFSHALCLKMRDVPGSILQRYALEEKEPIYVDREQVEALGLKTIVARIYSRDLLRSAGIVQHDPNSLARAISALRTLHRAGHLDVQERREEALPPPPQSSSASQANRVLPCARFRSIRTRIGSCSVILDLNDQAIAPDEEQQEKRALQELLIDVIWNHQDISDEHLRYMKGICLIPRKLWRRCQQWDNVFSFYDPVDQMIKIRSDQVKSRERFEVVFLIALGQSLLGNYALSKKMLNLYHDDEEVGKMYQIELQKEQVLTSYFSLDDLSLYMQLCKLQRSKKNTRLYNRVINKAEGFTPPGLFFGLFYAWYLDNRFAPNIEYNMSIMKHNMSELIPEQVRLLSQRKAMVDFFRDHVFCGNRSCVE